MSSHRLNVETGRWHKPVPIPYELRKCVNCDVLEDEYHFIIECNMFSELRLLYIPRKYYIRPSMFKFVSLVLSDNETVVRKLAMFVFKANEIRNDRLYNA